MTIPPRKIRQLPPALPAKDTDVFPISQMGEDGTPTTRAMTRGQNNAEMIGVIADARQEFVDMAEVEHDRLEAKIDTKADAPVTWNAVQGKPTTFSPTPHGHSVSEVNGLQAALDNAAATPPQSTWATLSGKPATFTPSAHVHAISDVTGLQAALDAKRGLSLLGTATVGETTVLALSLGVKRYSVTMTGTVVGDRLVATLTSAPQNGSLQDVYVSAANTVNVGVLTPALGLAQTVSVPLAIYKVV